MRNKQYGEQILTTPWGRWFYNADEGFIHYLPSYMRHSAINLKVAHGGLQEAVRRACSQAVTWQGELKTPKETT